MKKICFVNYDMSVTGGAEQVTASLANQLCKTNDIFIYSVLDNGEEAYHLDERVHYYKGLKDASRLRELITQTFRGFVDFIKKEKIDIVVTMGNYPALVVSLCRFFTKAKFIYCDHGALINQWYQKDITAIRLWDAITSHKVITLTEQTKNDYIQRFHMNPKKVQCIYNWIDPKVLEAKKDYNLNSKCILTIGRFGKEKGYDLLVKVAEKVLPEHPDWEWHLYGTGETFDEIKQQVQKRGLSEQLQLRGNIQEAYKYCSQYAFLVLTSYREGLPLVLLEACACGLPMVSFDVMTGPNEIIKNEKNGFLIKPYDCDEMAEKIEMLMDNGNLRMKQSEANEEQKEKFEYHKILKKWENLFDSI